MGSRERGLTDAVVTHSDCAGLFGGGSVLAHRGPMRRGAIVAIWLAVLAFARDKRFGLPFDARILARDYCAMLTGRHQRIVRKRKGSRTLPIKLARAAIVAIFPQGSELFSTRNLIDALAVKGFYVIVVSSRALDDRMSRELLSLRPASPPSGSVTGRSRCACMPSMRARSA